MAINEPMEPAKEASECVRAEDLKNLVGELRMMARRLLSSERVHSFTPTALAMSALRRAKLSDQDWSEVRWENRAHFFSALGTAMRHALVDHARRRKSSGRQYVLYFAPNEDFFRNLSAEAEERPERFILIDDALTRLGTENRRLADSIEQFYFLGYSIPEMAAHLSLSEKTVDRDLKKARTLLRKFLEESSRAA
jgi:RNA polymerase sigma factor (TIGR02999 family)